MADAPAAKRPRPGDDAAGAARPAAAGAAGGAPPARPPPPPAGAPAHAHVLAALQSSAGAVLREWFEE